MSEIKFKDSPLWVLEEPIALQPEETQTITLPSSIKTAAKALTITQEILKNGASEYQFNIKSSINCTIEYKNKNLKNETFMIMFNRDIEEENGYFTNTSTLNLQGNDVEKITLTITNNSTSELLEISNVSIYESDDIQITTIAKVFKEDIIASNLIKTTSVVTDGLLTDILITNALSREARRARAGQEVDYIQAEGIELGFYSAILGEETEQFTITTTSAGVSTTHYYWYQSIDGDNAYEYPTTMDPRENNPDISDSEREKFKFLVLKPSSLSKKLSIEFAYDENNHLTPSIIFGAGVGAEDGRAGKGFIYKNSNGFYHIYCQSSTGKNIGIVMDEDGVHITGWADQHCESITLKDNGFLLKFVGEETQRFEYIVNENDKLTGILQNNAYMTTINVESGNV